MSLLLHVREAEPVVVAVVVVLLKSRCLLFGEAGSFGSSCLLHSRSFASVRHVKLLLQVHDFLRSVCGWVHLNRLRRDRGEHEANVAEVAKFVSKHDDEILSHVKDDLFVELVFAELLEVAREVVVGEVVVAMVRVDGAPTHRCFAWVRANDRLVVATVLVGRSEDEEVVLAPCKANLCLCHFSSYRVCHVLFGCVGADFFDQSLKPVVGQAHHPRRLLEIVKLVVLHHVLVQGNGDLVHFLFIVDEDLQLVNALVAAFGGLLDEKDNHLAGDVPDFVVQA